MSHFVGHDQRVSPRLAGSDAFNRLDHMFQIAILNLIGGCCCWLLLLFSDGRMVDILLVHGDGQLTLVASADGQFAAGPAAGRQRAGRDQGEDGRRGRGRRHIFQFLVILLNNLNHFVVDHLFLVRLLAVHHRFLGERRPKIGHPTVPTGHRQSVDRFDLSGSASGQAIKSLLVGRLLIFVAFRLLLERFLLFDGILIWPATILVDSAGLAVLGWPPASGHSGHCHPV